MFCLRWLLGILRWAFLFFFCFFSVDDGRGMVVHKWRWCKEVVKFRYIPTFAWDAFDSWRKKVHTKKWCNAENERLKNIFHPPRFWVQNVHFQYSRVYFIGSIFLFRDFKLQKYQSFPPVDPIPLLTAREAPWPNIQQIFEVEISWSKATNIHIATNKNGSRSCLLKMILCWQQGFRWRETRNKRMWGWKKKYLEKK